LGWPSCIWRFNQIWRDVKGGSTKIWDPPPLTKWWLVGIHCVNMVINKLYIFLSSCCGDLGPLFLKKPLFYTFCTHFLHQVTNISDKKTILASTLIIIFQEMLKLSIFFKWKNLSKKVLYLWKCNIFLSTMYWNICSIFFSLFSKFGNPLLTFIVFHYNSMLFESGFVLLWHWKVYLTLKSFKGRKKAQTNIDILERY
jgi:hypothetical protein